LLPLKKFNRKKNTIYLYGETALYLCKAVDFKAPGFVPAFTESSVGDSDTADSGAVTAALC